MASPLSCLTLLPCHTVGSPCPGILPLVLGRDGNLLIIAESEGVWVLPGCGSAPLLPEVKQPREMVWGQQGRNECEDPAASFVVLTAGPSHFLLTPAASFHSCAAKGRSGCPQLPLCDPVWANTHGSPAVIARSLQGKAPFPWAWTPPLGETSWKPWFKKENRLCLHHMLCCLGAFHQKTCPASHHLLLQILSPAQITDKQKGSTEPRVGKTTSPLNGTGTEGAEQRLKEGDCLLIIQGLASHPAIKSWALRHFPQMYSPLCLLNRETASARPCKPD